MCVSKLFIPVLFLIATNAMGQTINSYGGSGSVPTPGGQDLLQTSLDRQLPSTVTQDQGNHLRPVKRGTKLVGVFSKAGGMGQAEFLVDGQSEYFAVGDIMRGGWEIVSISSTTVSLKRCATAKTSRCTSKKYIYQGG